MINAIDTASQIISQFTRVNSISSSEYESRTATYVQQGGRVKVEVVVDVYDRYGSINSVSINSPKTVDTVA